MSKPEVSNPQPRDLASEILQTYYGNARTAAPQFNLESFFQPKYGQVQLGNLQQSLFGYNVPGGPSGSAPLVPQMGTPIPTVGSPAQPTAPVVPGASTAGYLNSPSAPQDTIGPVNALPVGPDAGAAPQGTPIYNARGRLVGYQNPDSLKIPRPQGGNVLFTDPYAGDNTPSQTPGYHPGTLALGSAANTFQRGSDISDVARFGPAAVMAALQANPFLARSLMNLSSRTEDSPILRSLNTNAQNALALNGALSPQEQAAADESARSAMTARGMNFSGSPAAVAEVLNRDALTRQRQAAAQQFASGVQGLNQNQNDLVGRASQIFSTTLPDIFQTIMGRGGAAAGGGLGGGVPQQVGTGAQLFNPLNPYAQDIYNTNYNAQASANIANANTQAAGQNAAIGAGGSILAALIPQLFAASDERIKRNIRKTGEKTTSGIPIITWTYKFDPLRRKVRGVGARDVEKVAPHAVVSDPLTGLKKVDYGAIDAPFDFIGGGLRKAA